MKVKFVLESQRATGRFRIEMEASSLAELKEFMRLFDSLSTEKFPDEYLKDLAAISKKTISAWMTSGEIAESEG